MTDALRIVPGLDVATVDRNTNAVSARGLNNTFADKMLVLLDGRPIYNPIFGGTIWHEWNQFVPDIDRIEVIRGPGGARGGIRRPYPAANSASRRCVARTSAAVGTRAA